jgi:hypothetical protein
MKKRNKKRTFSVFVLMPFREPYDQYYQMVIKPAIRESGFDALRADEIAGPRPFIDDIVESIRKSSVVIADITGRNPNVMYEMGIAYAHNKPIIMLTQSVDEAPFDLSHHRMIVYKTTDPDWSAKLRGEIKTAILDALKEWQRESTDEVPKPRR